MGVYPQSSRPGCGPIHICFENDPSDSLFVLVDRGFLGVASRATRTRYR
jgi:hypothetical protein